MAHVSIFVLYITFIILFFLYKQTRTVVLLLLAVLVVITIIAQQIEHFITVLKVKITWYLLRVNYQD